MKFIELIRMIGINLMQNKSKVLLTSLGIIIGTLTIILVIAIGRGGEEQIAQQYSNISAETIYVNVAYTPDLDYKTLPRLTQEHLDIMLEENSYLRDVYLRCVIYQQVRIGKEKDMSSIATVTAGYAEVSNLSLDAGVDFSDADHEDARKVVVIGASVAEKYFGNAENAVGDSVRIDDTRYEIIGVLNKKAEGLQGLSPDDTIFVPFQTAQESNLLDIYAIPQAVALVTSTEMIDKAKTRLKSTIDYVLENSTMYSIEDAGSRIEAAMESARTMKMLLIAVAAIVFVVGGIGIMNVLFVTVKERTREIGILKAIGTKKKDILLLFLLESVGMGIFGGIIGMMCSYFVLPLIQRADIAVSPSVSGQLVALSFAVFTSAVFGFYPAYKASELKPIDALNYE